MYLKFIDFNKCTLYFCLIHCLILLNLFFHSSMDECLQCFQNFTTKNNGDWRSSCSSPTMGKHDFLQCVFSPECIFLYLWNSWVKVYFFLLLKLVNVCDRQKGPCMFYLHNIFHLCHCQINKWIINFEWLTTGEIINFSEANCKASLSVVAIKSISLLIMSFPLAS